MNDRFRHALGRAGQPKYDTMKKLLTIGSALIAGHLAVAQVELGGKAGLNIHFQQIKLASSAPAGMEKPEGTSGAGFHIGVFAQNDLSEKLYLRPELLFSTRSSMETLTATLDLPGISSRTELETKTNLSYLELPVLLGGRLSERFALEIGPGFGFLMGYKEQEKGTLTVTDAEGTVVTSLDSEYNDTRGLRKIEVAGVVGLNYRANNGLDLGLRYWHGLNTLNEDTRVVLGFQRVVQLSVGYAFMRG